MRTWDIFKTIWWQPFLSSLWVGVEIFHIVLQELPPRVREKWGIIKMISFFPSWAWDIVFFGGLILITLRGVKRLISQKESEFNVQINKIQTQLDQLQDYNFLSLKEACDKLVEEENKILTLPTGIRQKRLFNPNEYYDEYAKYFAEVDTILGNSPSDQLTQRRYIAENKFLHGKIKIERGELSLYNAGNYDSPEYVALVIKNENLMTDIEKIILLLTKPLNEIINYIYDLCQSDELLYRFVQINIKGLFNSKEEIINCLAKHYSQKTCFLIYGENISSREKKLISKNSLNNMYFEDGGSSLYDISTKEPKYINLFIRRRDYDNAILHATIEFKKTMFEGESTNS